MKLNKEEVGLLYLLVMKATKEKGFNTHIKEQLNSLLIRLEKEERK
jgi:hypothetical protein